MEQRERQGVSSFAFLNQSIALATRLKVISPEEAKGCSEQEIRALENKLGITLPRAYREFLRWAGKDAGELLAGSSWHHDRDNLVLLQSGARELLAENNHPEPLPADAYVFRMHQGYVFYFFRLGEGENPPLYRFHEAYRVAGFTKEFCAFTDFLEYKILSLYLYKTKAAPETQTLLAEQYSPCSNVEQRVGWNAMEIDN